MATIPHWLNGYAVHTEATRQLPVHNPATGQVIHHVNLADSDLVNQAVQMAKKAFPDWSATPAIKRARIFFKYKALLDKNIDVLARLVSEEHGKLLDDARGSVLRGIEVVELACGAPQLLKGWFSENVATDVDCTTLRQALGVCVGITPFNFPAMIPLWMFPLALVCGNTFVLKPSEKTPSCPFDLCSVCYNIFMTKIKVAINGFGRIGRAFLKIAWERAEIEIVAVNDLGSIESLAYLLRHDTVYRNWNHKVEISGTDLLIDGKVIKFISEKDTSKLPWKDLGVNVVVESTGLFTSYDKAKFHIDQGAKKVVISAPSKGGDPSTSSGASASERGNHIVRDK